MTYEGDSEEAMDCIEDIMDSIDIEKATPTQMREALRSIAELFEGEAEEDEDEEEEFEDGDGPDEEDGSAAPEMPGTFAQPQPEKKRKSHGS